VDAIEKTGHIRAKAQSHRAAWETLRRPAEVAAWGKHTPPRYSASLPAGRAVRWRARVAGASSPAAAPAARGVMDWRRCPTEEKTQRPIVRALRSSLGQGRRMNRAERRTSAGFHHGHHDLRVARHVEHDPIQIRAATNDPNELTWADGLHREKVPRDAPRRSPGLLATGASGHLRKYARIRGGVNRPVRRILDLTGVGDMLVFEEAGDGSDRLPRTPLIDRAPARRRTGGGARDCTSESAIEAVACDPTRTVRVGTGTADHRLPPRPPRHTSDENGTTVEMMFVWR
jgi:hypothetical protein